MANTNAKYYLRKSKYTIIGTIRHKVNVMSSID